MKLILGSALWGWTIEPQTAHHLLSTFYEAGHRYIDTATNYPINKNPEAFRLAETLLADWLNAHQIKDTKVIVKIGSLSNDGSPEINLNPSYLMVCVDHYERLLGPNLDCLAIHWDNREAPDDIHHTMSAMEEIKRSGHRIGLSGIKRPDLYAATNSGLLDHWIVQVKHNLLTQHSYSTYKDMHGQSTFYAYGLNSGGMNLSGSYGDNSSATVRAIAPPTKLERFKQLIDELDGPSPSKPTTLNMLAMAYIHNFPGIQGAIVGPSNISQLDETLHYNQILNSTDTHDIYSRITDLIGD